MKKKIVVIDSNPNYRKKMVDALQGEDDYEVESAPDGRAGLKLIKSYKPDMAALEIILPQMNGFRLISDLKSDPDFKDLPILVLTSVVVSHSEDVKGYKIGHEKYFNADSVLNKPFDEDDFLDKVEEILFEDRPKRKTGKEKILLVDDDPAINQLLGAILNKEGYETISSGNGEKGLELMSSEKPDLVLLDLMMPGMTGAEVLEIAQKDFPEIPIIMVTAHGSEEKAVQLMKGGAMDYIRKPFDSEEVRVRVREGVMKAKLLAAENNFNTRLAETTELLLAQMERVEESPYGMRHVVLTFVVTLIGAIIGIYFALVSGN